MIRKLRLSPLLAATCALAAMPSYALQLVDARDGVAVEAVIALKEPTRIRIENAPITDVFGNIYSSNCGPLPTAAGAAATVAPSPPAVNPAGEIALECDRDKGEIYVRPVGNAAKPINLFVSSANATYTLLLRRSDTPSDTIVIRDRTPRPIDTNMSSSRQGPLGPSANPIRAMKVLLVAMASDRVPADIRVEETNRLVPLWNEVRFSLMRTYEGRSLVGEKYLLTNISKQAMVLAEQEFDRADGGVVGVAIDNLNLRPGDSTSVYVIRLGSGS
ncbi:MAG TPA: type-F conjugative transfer system secretin TraK [Noviherbaspirillum sp.]